MKRVYDFSELVVGNVYHVECGIWRGDLPFVRCEKVGSRVKYRFVFGDVCNWENSFCILSAKSNLKVYSL